MVTKWRIYAAMRKLLSASGLLGEVHPVAGFGKGRVVKTGFAIRSDQLIYSSR